MVIFSAAHCILPLPPETLCKHCRSTCTPPTLQPVDQNYSTNGTFNGGSGGGGGGPIATVCFGGAAPDANTEWDQAMYLARQWLTNTVQNISVSIFYDFQNGGRNVTAGENNFGIASCDGDACCCEHEATSGGSMVCNICADDSGGGGGGGSGGGWAFKDSYHAATTLQHTFAVRNFLTELLPNEKGRPPFNYALAFGAELPPPQVPSTFAQGLGEEPVGAIAVWTLSVPKECAAVVLTGVANQSKCSGKIWGGDLPASSNVSCADACRSTIGCRSFTVWHPSDPNTHGAPRFKTVVCAQ
jgi:hypothetical protein